MKFKDYCKQRQELNEGIKEKIAAGIKASIVGAALACPSGQCLGDSRGEAKTGSQRITTTIPQDLLDAKIKGTELDNLRRKYGRFPTIKELEIHRKEMKEFYKKMQEKYPIKHWN